MEFKVQETGKIKRDVNDAWELREMGERNAK